MPHTVSEPFQYSSGPTSGTTLAIVGEAWGKGEEATQRPFVGASGQELNRLLAEAGLHRDQCFCTNVFPIRPESNDISNLCTPKALAGELYPMPPLATGKYPKRELLPELHRLRTELQSVQPNLILALGNTAAWATLYRTGISTIRGTIAQSALAPGCKVLPSYHPSAILRNWALRPILLADLLKAKRESAFPSIVRPKRKVQIAPTLSQLAKWFSQPAEAYAVDIETARGQITMIGFARSRSDAIVVPFVDMDQQSRSYWSTPADETAAWGLVAKALATDVPKIFQNGIYDLGYLSRLGLRVRNAIEDTMLLHHSMYPELQKGLGFLGSIYTDEASWKLMRRRAVAGTTLKKDE